MNQAFHRIFFLSGLMGMVALPLVAGCGDDTSGSGGGTGGTGGATSSSNAGGSGGAGGSETQGTLISAAEGGTVNAPGGAKLVIPPNALAQDTYITVAESSPSGLPESGSIQSLVLDFGPDGLDFLLPATLEIPTPSGALGAGEQHVISTFAAGDSAWTDLATSAGASTLSAPVEHFSLFTVRVVTGAGATCEVLAGCGGDLTGMWTLPANGEACLAYDGELIPNCSGASIALEIDYTAFTLDFQMGGTYGLTAAGELTVTTTVPKSCIANQPCSAVGDGCTDQGASCLCAEPPEVQDDIEQGTWSVASNTLTLTPSGGEPETWTYCVTGTTLDLYQVDVDPDSGATATSRISLVKQ